MPDFNFNLLDLTKTIAKTNIYIPYYLIYTDIINPIDFIKKVHEKVKLNCEADNFSITIYETG
ncbi:MAG: hypothetical protein A2W95_01210 [Bacteroidetes bacterium GWA2_40_14]|jgi:hypothetical protein|nr:MAG: hypothetical protein A2W95_01210 [Bacteroidetes bacterium GWA2_40_14]